MVFVWPLSSSIEMMCVELDTNRIIEASEIDEKNNYREKAL
jgi:hypothetical protein